MAMATITVMMRTKPQMLPPEEADVAPCLMVKVVFAEPSFDTMFRVWLPRLRLPIYVALSSTPVEPSLTV